MVNTEATRHIMIAISLPNTLSQRIQLHFVATYDYKSGKGQHLLTRKGDHNTRITFTTKDKAR
jgi:hypothetical protein